MWYYITYYNVTYCIGQRLINRKNVGDALRLALHGDTVILRCLRQD